MTRLSRPARCLWATLALGLGLAPGAWATDPPTPAIRCGTPRFLPPPPPDDHGFSVVMPIAIEPSGRPVSGGVLVSVPDRDKEKERRPPRDLPPVDAPDLRLDVAIEIFEPGGSLEEAPRAEEGLPPSLRRPEARFLAVELRRLLEDSGHWGTVRVVPAFGDGFDVVVSGRVLHSSRGHLEIEVVARDAMGRRLPPETHQGDGVGARQEVLAGIASSLLRWRDDAPHAALPAQHAAALLRFGARLAPQIFERYLPPPMGSDPAAASASPSAPPPDPRDPLMQRLARIADQDQTFLTILNRHYTELHDVMMPPYDQWRAEGTVARPSSALSTLEDAVRAFETPGEPSRVRAEGYDKMLAGSVEGQFLAWRRLAVRALRVETAVAR